MLVTAFLAVLAAVGSAHSHSLTSTRFALQRKPEHEVATLPKAPHVVQLASQPRSSYKRALLKAVSKTVQSAKDVTPLAATDGDIEYVAPITVGGQKFQVIVDTGR